MERITPSEPSAKLPAEDDPFGDSFTTFPVRIAFRLILIQSD